LTMGTMSKIIESRNFAKIISFFLALLLWFFVSGDSQEALGLEARRSFGNIPLSYRNLGEDLVIINMDHSITLSLQGVPQAFDGLTPAHLEAYVDLSGKKEGRHEIRINAEAPQGLSVVSIEPAKATIILENLITKQMNVEGSLEGEPAGGKIVNEVYFSPEEVFVRGTRDKVDSVHSVVFSIYVGGAEGTINDSIKLVPVDDKQKPVQGVAVAPEEVEVTVSFSLPQKDVPVEVIFVDNVEDKVEVVSFEPSIVTVEGPWFLLEEINSLQTEAIILDDLELPSTIEVPLIFPEGVRPVQHKTVTVRIFPIE
jgi:YbbR domain-containing protein